MEDKPLNLKQTLFVGYYTEGETKGNCKQSMLKAGYKAGYAIKWAGCFIGAIRGLREAIDDRLADITGYKNLCIEVVGANFLENRRLAKDKGDIGQMNRADENLGKHVGLYALDNAQKAEEAKLDEVTAKEAGRIANILNLEATRKGKVG